MKAINIEEQNVLGITIGWVYQVEGSDLWGCVTRPETSPREVEYETKEEAAEMLRERIAVNGGGVQMADPGAYLVISRRTDEYLGDYSRCVACGEVAYYTSEGESALNVVRWEITRGDDIEMNCSSGLGSPLEAAAKANAIQVAIDEAKTVLRNGVAA